MLNAMVAPFITFGPWISGAEVPTGSRAAHAPNSSASSRPIPEDVSVIKAVP
jgi:hypothetical protein